MLASSCIVLSTNTVLILCYRTVLSVVSTFNIILLELYTRNKIVSLTRTSHMVHKVTPLRLQA